MKSVASILTTAILFSALSLAYLGSANASTDEGFVASQCGSVELSSKIKSICFGGANAKGNELVQIQKADGQAEVFTVVDRQSLMSALDGGRVKANLFLQNASGEKQALQVIFFRDGVAQSARGTIEQTPVLVREFSIQ